MKKLFQNQVVAWAILILAVVLACVWGLSRKNAYESKKTTELLDVKPYHWIDDSADMLSSDTEKTIEEYNSQWNQQYHAVIAVATLPTLKGWENKENAGGQEYGEALGGKWKLNDNDMLLLLVRDEYWYVILGDSVAESIQLNRHEAKLEAVMSESYYKGNFDAAVVNFFRQADVFYAQASLMNSQTTWGDYQQPAKTGHVSIFKVILLIGAIFLVWAILDRIRYKRYRRRSVVNVGVPAVSYYPIFWGRPSRAAVPHAPVPPARPGVYHRPAQSNRPSGTYPVQKPGAAKGSLRPTSRPSTPARPASKPGSSSRPSGFGKSDFGGGKR